MTCHFSNVDDLLVDMHWSMLTPMFTPMFVSVNNNVCQCSPMFVIVFWYWLMFLGEVLSLHFWHRYSNKKSQHVKRHCWSLLMNYPHIESHFQSLTKTSFEESQCRMTTAYKGWFLSKNVLLFVDLLLPLFVIWLQNPSHLWWTAKQMPFNL